MQTLSLSTLTALSPLDGRYFDKTKKLAPYFSEAGFIYYRVKVEIIWLIALSEAGFKEIKPFSKFEKDLLNKISSNFSILDAKRVKEIEKITNHDVKAIEYWIKEKIKKNKKLTSASEFIHFACTSEDINNVAYGLILKRSRDDLLIPQIKLIISRLVNLAHHNSSTSMISRTHGQPASPTTLGKEIANFVSRLNKSLKILENIKVFGKMNGAVGNYNAHYSAYPKFNWEKFSKQVVEKRFGLIFNPYSVQIEPHDYMAELFDAISRINTILIDLNRDFWGYISIGYFKQKIKNSEIGSSTMPHKVNPINFENSEGNLGISNAILKHLSEKLPISRWQRDLTDSTVLRNVGVSFGHSLLAYKNIIEGLNRIETDKEIIKKDIMNNWEILAEPIQTVMKKHGLKNSYEKLKELTHGKKLDKEDIENFILELKIPNEAKKYLLSLTPENYIGIAQRLACKIKSY
tara:strand:- start:126 stop:1511 length:1386 start_codon:yes stop_codon:yes gene_type:complete